MMLLLLVLRLPPVVLGAALGVSVPWEEMVSCVMLTPERESEKAVAGLAALPTLSMEETRPRDTRGRRRRLGEPDRKLSSQVLSRLASSRFLLPPTPPMPMSSEQSFAAAAAAMVSIPEPAPAPAAAAVLELEAASPPNRLRAGETPTVALLRWW